MGFGIKIGKKKKNSNLKDGKSKHKVGNRSTYYRLIGAVWLGGMKLNVMVIVMGIRMERKRKVIILFG